MCKYCVIYTDRASLFFRIFESLIYIYIARVKFDVCFEFEYYRPCYSIFIIIITSKLLFFDFEGVVKTFERSLSVSKDIFMNDKL